MSNENHPKCQIVAALLAYFLMAETFVMPQEAIGASPNVEVINKAEADAFRSKRGVHDFGDSKRGFLNPEFVLVTGVRDFGGGCTYGSPMPIMDKTKLHTMD